MKLFHRKKKNFTEPNMQEAYKRMYGDIDVARDLRDKRQPLFDIIFNVQAAFSNQLDIDTLKKGTRLIVEKEDEKWVMYEHICYYGGCKYGAVTFSDEYEAYKHAYILSEFSAAKSLYNQGGGPVLADVNTACPNYGECSGID